MNLELIFDMRVAIEIKKQVESWSENVAVISA